MGVISDMISRVSLQNGSQYPKSPQFKSRVVNKGLYAVEYLDTVLSRRQPPPSVSYQINATDIETLKKVSLFIQSDNPDTELKNLYQMYKNDFVGQYRYISPKRFNNMLSQDNASVFILKSSEENLGTYVVNIPADKNMYIWMVDLNPKYRNTRKGAEIISDCWENIKNLAKENGCEKLSLHVDSKRHNLVNLYKRLGFEIRKNDTKVYRKRYPNGNIAYYMEKDL